MDLQLYDGNQVTTNQSSVIQSEEEQINKSSRQSLALHDIDHYIYGGMIRKKPYQKNFAIGYPRDRFGVLDAENSFSWYSSHDAYLAGEEPYGSISICASTKVKINSDDNYIQIVPDIDIKPFQLESIDDGKLREDWVEILKGRIKILQNRNLDKIKDVVISILNASSIEGKALIKAFSSSPGSFKTLRLVITNEDDHEELKEFLEDETSNSDLQIQEKIFITNINLEDIDSAKDALHKTDVAIITRPDLDEEKRQTILLKYITVLQAASTTFTILTSSIMAILPSSGEGKVFSVIEKCLKESDLCYTIVRLPFLMETFLTYSEDLLDNNLLSLPVSNDTDFTAFSLSDYGQVVLHIISALKIHSGKTYRLTAPLMTVNDLIYVIEGYTNIDITYDRITYDQFVNRSIGKGYFTWAVTEQKEYFELVDNLSLIVSNQTDDFFEITGEQPKGLAKWVMENKKMFVRKSREINDDNSIRSSVISRRKSAIQRADNKFGVRRGSGKSFFVDGA